MRGVFKLQIFNYMRILSSFFCVRPYLQETFLSPQYKKKQIWIQNRRIEDEGIEEIEVNRNVGIEDNCVFFGCGDFNGHIGTTLRTEPCARKSLSLSLRKI